MKKLNRHENIAFRTRQATLLLSLLCVAGSAALAQQESHYTHFMHNRVAFNPGAIGSERSAVFTALARSQWIGVDGAPQTQTVNFHAPLLNDRIGLGAHVARHTIGLNSRYEAGGAYSYMIRVPKGALRMGLQTSVRMIRTDYNRARPIQPIDLDAAIPASMQSKYVLNFGAGIYYYDETGKFYFGLGVPRLLQNNIDLADEELAISRELRHYFMSGGARFALSDDIAIRPQFLFKYVAGAPFDADVNLTFSFVQTFHFGASYRIGGDRTSALGESFAVLAGIDLSDHLLFGLSYDYTLTQLRPGQSGTVEGVLRYRFAKSKVDEKPKDKIDGRNLPKTQQKEGFYD
jgi:type IX secretion system PorP/SprF family membrane protein